ncbi:MAG: phosphoribosyltransferase family protein [Spirochaetaceae bacterium]|jgi:hypoxanthine phosphoribosyltransferase|nr:phosphoribosyltransferase family protein [Spirochaetaceae bacterium]
MEKYYISYNKIHNIMKSLSEQLLESGFDFDYIVAIGTGGFIPARMMKTFINKPILTVGIAYYDLNDNIMDKPNIIQWIDDADKKLEGKKILLVDEVDDSRATIGYCLEKLLSHKPKEISVAVVHNKMKEKRGVIPDEITKYFAGETLGDQWICYPWDADDPYDHDKKC